MKRSGILLISIGLATMMGCSDSSRIQTKTIDKEAIKKETAMVLDGFFEAWRKGDAENVISHLSGDGFVSMPTIDVTEDFQIVKRSTYDIAEDFAVEEIKYQRIEIFTHSDMAYELGWLDDVLIEKESGDTIKGHQRALIVWKKVENEWKLHRWMLQE